MPSLGHRLPVFPQNEAASSISLNARIYIDKDDKGSARAFYSIMQVNLASVEFLAVDTAEREIWELVAKAMKLQPGAVKKVATKEAALGIAVRTRSSEAKRDNIKDVLDAAGPDGFAIWSQGTYEHVKNSQAGWKRLEQILDLNPNEFAKK